MGGATYGVYVIHIIIKDLPIMKGLFNWMIGKGMNYLIADFFYVFMTYLFSAVVVLFVQKSKFLITKTLKSRGLKLTKKSREEI